MEKLRARVTEGVAQSLGVEAGSLGCQASTFPLPHTCYGPQERVAFMTISAAGSGERGQPALWGFPGSTRRWLEGP